MTENATIHCGVAWGRFDAIVPRRCNGATLAAILSPTAGIDTECMTMRIAGMAHKIAHDEIVEFRTGQELRVCNTREAHYIQTILMLTGQWVLNLDLWVSRNTTAIFAKVVVNARTALRFDELRVLHEPRVFDDGPYDELHELDPRELADDEQLFDFHVYFNVLHVEGNRIVNGSGPTSKCRFCEESPAYIMLLPCQHRCVCAECLDLASGHCPICRTKIHTTLNRGY
ncbi:MAG: RING finger protein [Candidatus Omnitrophota bacterium]